jgi:peptidoglycan/xylan/chitin deacetylase (PgdA/CDA1 family)
VRLDRLITLGVVQPIGRAFGRIPAFDAPPSETGRTLPVLMYHSISDDPEPAFSPYYKVCTSPARFAEQMQWLAEAGWRGVTLTDGLAWLKGNRVSGEQGAVTSDQSAVNGKQSPNSGPKIQDPKPQIQSSASSDLSRQSPTGDGGSISVFPSAHDFASVSPMREPRTNTGLALASNGAPLTAHSEKKPVAITFDDGFRDFHTAAFPALQQHGFSATMYLPTAFIGENRLTFKSRECLSWPEIRELAASGVEFGSHTVNHPKLVELAWPEIERELRDSRIAIEQQLGQPALSFAYPYAFPRKAGEFALRFREILVRTGYESCATTSLGRARPSGDRLQIPRLPANSADDRALLNAKLNGAYDWLATPQQTLKNLKGIRSGSTSAQPVEKPGR